MTQVLDKLQIFYARLHFTCNILIQVCNLPVSFDTGYQTGYKNFTIKKNRPVIDYYRFRIRLYYFNSGFRVTFHNIIDTHNLPVLFVGDDYGV